MIVFFRSGDNNVLEKQLDCMLQWTREFREQTLDLGDVILFDVVCGDFNFDNMSPGMLTKHLTHFAKGKCLVFELHTQVPIAFALVNVIYCRDPYPK